MTDPRIELINEKNGLIVYLKSKARSQDFHGVADAAMNIRELDAKLEVYDNLINRRLLEIDN